MLILAPQLISHHILLRLYYQEGLNAGIIAGEQRAHDESFIMGFEEGEKLGSQLGFIAGSVYALLRDKSYSLQDNTAKRIKKLLEEICNMSFGNDEDPGKDARLHGIQVAYRGLVRVLPERLSLLPETGASSTKSSLDF